MGRRKLLAENITEFTTRHQSPNYDWCNTTDGTGGKNTSWILCQPIPEKVLVPKKPVYNLADIDSRILDVKIEPSKWQDPTKTKMAWEVSKLDENGMQL